MFDGGSLWWYTIDISNINEGTKEKKQPRRHQAKRWDVRRKIRRGTSNGNNKDSLIIITTRNAKDQEHRLMAETITNVKNEEDEEMEVVVTTAAVGMLCLVFNLGV